MELKGKQLMNIVLAMLFTMFAGAINVFGFIKIGNLFISFMSGNTARLSVAVVQGAFHEVLPFVYAILSFVFGAFLGTYIKEKSDKNQMLIGVSMSLVGLIFCLFFYLAGNMQFVMVCLAMTMGMQNIGQIEVNGCVIGKTFVSGVLYQLGGTLAQVAVGKSKKKHALLYLISWMMILVGGGLGTFSLYAIGAEYTIILMILYLLILFLFLLRYEREERRESID